MSGENSYVVQLHHFAALNIAETLTQDIAVCTVSVLYFYIEYTSYFNMTLNLTGKLMNH